MESNASFWEAVLGAAASLRSSKLRSFLTLLGIILATTTLIAVITLVGATNKLKHVNAVPEKTVETMKENLTWAKRQMK